MAARDEFLAAGYKPFMPAVCQQCKEAIESLQAPSGNLVFFNPEDHPTAPGVMHSVALGTCGEAVESPSLPPIKGQLAIGDRQ